MSNQLFGNQDSINMRETKVGLVVAIHESEKHRPNGMYLFSQYIDAIFHSVDYPFKVYAFDNASTTPVVLEEPNEALQITRVEDQYTGGCTYAWNEGIKQALDEGCEVVIITSDDQIYNETINNFIDEIVSNKKNGNAIFGPLSNNPNNIYQKANGPSDFVKEISGDPHDELNGFCLAMTRETIEKNFYDDERNFFSTDPKCKWGGQDVEVQSRVDTSFIVGTCYVHHMKVGGWRQIRASENG